MPLIKHHHKTYVLQALGFLGLIAFTAVTVAVGDAQYSASVLKQEDSLSQIEEEADDSSQPCGNVDLMSVLLQHFH